jgi:hypothetical protein
MRSFTITDNLIAVCESENTRYGFRHLATLLRNGHEIGKAKACYYNRTWERYAYQSVLRHLVEKASDRLDETEQSLFKHKIEHVFN